MSQILQFDEPTLSERAYIFSKHEKLKNKRICCAFFFFFLRYMLEFLTILCPQSVGWWVILVQVCVVFFRAYFVEQL